MIEIDNRNIFFDKLKTGINLFTGAGFSVLESPSGNRLPVASELCGDICTKFKLDASYSHDLEKLSSILKKVEDKNKNYKKQLQSPFIAENEINVAVIGILKQIEQLKLRIIDCERLESLCQ